MSEPCSPLLRISRELRDEIYYQAFRISNDRDQAFKLSEIGNYSGADFNSKIARLSDPPSLLRACKQIRDEASRVLFGRCVLFSSHMLYRLVREHEELERFTHAPIYIYRFPPQYLHLVKDLTMGFNLRLALPTQGEGCTLLDTPTFAELATALPNLKKVTIWLHFSFQPPIQRCHESPQELLDGTKHWLGNGFSHIEKVEIILNGRNPVLEEEEEEEEWADAEYREFSAKMWHNVLVRYERSRFCEIVDTDDIFLKIN